MIVSYPRRQQLRRLRRAGSYGAIAAFALAGAALVAVAGDLVTSLGLTLVSGLFALASRRVARLAARSRVDAARWLARRRRLYPRGVVPVLCVARARRLDYIDGDVRIVSLDRLVPSLRAAGNTPAVAASPRS